MSWDFNLGVMIGIFTHTAWVWVVLPYFSKAARESRRMKREERKWLK